VYLPPIQSTKTKLENANANTYSPNPYQGKIFKKKIKKLVTHNAISKMCNMENI
jgi:hypothetical protein